MSKEQQIEEAYAEYVRRMAELAEQAIAEANKAVAARLKLDRAIEREMKEKGL